ncbi:MAG: proton-conducting transporter membrane subunit, partial [Thiohalocapsa sp.]
SLVMIASQTGTSLPTAEDLAVIDGLTIALLLLGLGIKAGMVPLHVWLPLAHPAAPIAASAVLSGVMIKTALLGWMRFLPIGAIALPDWGGLLVFAGTLTLLFALPVGLTQSDPKVVLAYSSISKMGLMMLVLGVALIEPALAPAAVAGIAFYAANHALVKGGLFLGVGMRKYSATRPPVIQALVLGGLVFLALSLAGAPLTSGAVAKYELKPVLGAVDWAWIAAVVAISTFGTTLLMVRFVWLSYRIEPHSEPGYRWPGVGWGLLIALVLGISLVFGAWPAWKTNLVNVPLALNLGLLALLIGLLRPKLLAPLADRIPPGDILSPASSIWTQASDYYQATERRWQTSRGRMQEIANGAYQRILGASSGDPERSLRHWTVAGGVWIGISAVLLLFVLAGLPPKTVSIHPSPLPEAPQEVAPHRPDGDAKHRIAAPLDPTPTPDPTDLVVATDAAPVDTMPAGSGTVQETAFTPVPAAEVSTPNEAQSDTQAEQGSESIETAPRTSSEATTVQATETQTDVTASRAKVDPAARSNALASERAFAWAIEAPPAMASQPDVDPGAGVAALCETDRIYVFAPGGVAGPELELNRCTAAGEPMRAPDRNREVTRRVQLLLALRGYEPGPADGLIGSRTKAAVRRMQQDSGLNTDGNITFEVLDLLQTDAAD